MHRGAPVESLGITHEALDKVLSSIVRDLLINCILKLCCISEGYLTYLLCKIWKNFTYSILNDVQKDPH